MRADPSKMDPIMPLSSEASAWRHPLCRRPTMTPPVVERPREGHACLTRVSSLCRDSVLVGADLTLGADFLHVVTPAMLASQAQPKELLFAESYGNSSESQFHWCSLMWLGSQAHPCTGPCRQMNAMLSSASPRAGA